MAGPVPPTPPPRLAALAGLDDREALADAFARRAGYEPEALSHWDPKADFQREIEGWLAGAVSRASPVPYAFSGYLDLDDATLRARLGEDQSRGLVATSGGTTSITVVATFLKSVGIRSVHVVTPSYFAFEALCSNLGIATAFAPTARAEDGYRLPPPPVPASDAAWLTSPVFGASRYLDPAAVAAWIDALPPATLVVVDESLAYPDRSVLGSVASMGRVIRITTPNKALCINGEKVSFVSAVAGLGPLAVLPVAQGAGIGGALVREALGRAAAAGLDDVRLLQSTYDNASFCLYAKLDRLTHHCEILETGNSSWRLKTRA